MVGDKAPGLAGVVGGPAVQLDDDRGHAGCGSTELSLARYAREARRVRSAQTVLATAQTNATLPLRSSV